jgi:hypothetical protein
MGEQNAAPESYWRIVPLAPVEEVTLSPEYFIP